MSTLSNFSSTLLYLRQRAGMSQQELAEKSGCSRSAIGMYETGKREPDLETLEALADIFNVDMDFLTGRMESSEWSVRFRKKLDEELHDVDISDLEAAGLDNKDLALVISGTSKLTFDYACDIADALGVSFDYMLGRKNEKSPTPVARDRRVQEFITLFSQLSEDQQRMVIAQIKGILADQ